MDFDLDALLADLSPEERAAIDKRAQTLSVDAEAYASAVAALDEAEANTPIATKSDDVREAERLRDDFGYFVAQMWSVVEPSSTFQPVKHIDAICDHLQACAEGRIKRLLVNVPPGHAKSLIVAVFWPAWMWLRNPGWRVLTGSYALDLAIRDAQRARELITSDEYERIKIALGLTWSISSDQNVKSNYSNTAKGFRMALSVGSKATGFRGDCLIFDDLVNVKAPHKITRESLEEARSWWKGTMSSRLNDLRTGVKIGIMQRVSEFDPCEDLIRSRTASGAWEYDLVALPSEYDPDLYRALGRDSDTTSIGWKDWRTERGELLFPERFDSTVLAGVKMDLGAAAYAAQHGQRPSPASGGLLHRSWWRFWYPAGVEEPRPVLVPAAGGGVIECVQRRLPSQLAKQTISADLTFKDGANSDNVVMQVWAWGDEDGCREDRFLLDQRCRKMDFVETLRVFRALCDDWPEATTKLVEDKANGPAVMRSLRGEISGIIPVNPMGSKEARVNAISPIIESGHVYLPHPSVAPWVADFLLEATSFPKGAHDDQVDAMSQFLARKRVIVV